MDLFELVVIRQAISVPLEKSCSPTLVSVIGLIEKSIVFRIKNAVRAPAIVKNKLLLQKRLLGLRCKNVAV